MNKSIGWIVHRLYINSFLSFFFFFLSLLTKWAWLDKNILWHRPFVCICHQSNVNFTVHIVVIIRMVKLALDWCEIHNGKMSPKTFFFLNSVISIVHATNDIARSSNWLVDLKCIRLHLVVCNIIILYALQSFNFTIQKFLFSLYITINITNSAFYTASWWLLILGVIYD